MPVVYDYSIQNDFPNHIVDCASLRDELVFDYNFEESLAVSSMDDVCSVQVSALLSDPQKDSLDSAVAAHLGAAKPFEKNHLEKEYFSTRIVRETWWARSAGGVLSIKVEETIYTYSGSRLLSEEMKQYDRAGAVTKTRAWAYSQEKIGKTLRVRKVEQ